MMRASEKAREARPGACIAHAEGRSKQPPHTEQACAGSRVEAPTAASRQQNEDRSENQRRHEAAQAITLMVWSEEAETTTPLRPSTSGRNGGAWSGRSTAQKRDTRQTIDQSRQKGQCKMLQRQAKDTERNPQSCDRHTQGRTQQRAGRHDQRHRPGRERD